MALPSGILFGFIAFEQPERNDDDDDGKNNNDFEAVAEADADDEADDEFCNEGDADDAGMERNGLLKEAPSLLVQRDLLLLLVLFLLMTMSSPSLLVFERITFPQILSDDDAEG